MCLQTFLLQAREKGINKVYFFYKDKDGSLKNICFQDNIFFQVKSNRSIRFLNPLRVMNTLEKVRSGEVKIVGRGYYPKKITEKEFEKNYFRKGAVSWL